MGESHDPDPPSQVADVLHRTADDRFVLEATEEGPPRVAHVVPGLRERFDLTDPVGATPSDAFEEPLGPGIGRACRECFDRGDAVTHRSERRDEGATAYEVELSPVRNGQRIAWVVGTVRDVTERERLRLELETTADYLDAILEHVPLHLYVKDAAGRHLAVSDFYVENVPFATDRSELIGRTDREIYPGDMGEDSYEDDLRVVEEGEPIIKKESHIPSLDMWTLTSKLPWGEDGEIRGLVGVTLDITKRKQYARDLERRNEQLSEFANIIAHDLKNPLNQAEGYLDLARETGDPDHFAAVEEALERSIEITTGLERLVQASDGVDGRQVDLDDVARRAWEQVVDAGEDSNWEGDPNGDPADTLEVTATDPVDADASWLQTLLENLFRNSLDHAGPDVSVELGDLADADGFYLADDGPGILPDDRQAVMQAGHTTKDGDGGIGLWIVGRVVDAHGWDLSIDESESGGARFEVRTG